MDIAAHIGQLVLEHECVIIPGLGAFLTNSHASEINQRHHSIQPPIRSLVFNAQLNSNDGLLAHYLSQRLDFSYRTSLHLLEVFASYCQRDLADGKQIAFGDLGILDKNSHHKLEFYPNTAINYNEDAYGLKPLAIKSIEREAGFGLNAPIRKMETRSKTAKVIAINRTLRKVAAVLIPAAILLSALLYLPSVVQNKQLHQSSVFSFMDSLKSSIFSNDKPDDTAIETTIEATFEIPASEIAGEKAALDLVADKKETETIENPSEISVEKLTVEIPKGNYHIICGSFVEMKRAEAMVNHLKAKGFQAYVAGQSKSGSFRVSIQSCANSEDASRQIKLIRYQGYDMAWILKKTY